MKERKRSGRFADVVEAAERALAMPVPPPQLTWTSRAPTDRSHARDPGDAWVVAMEPWLVQDGLHGALYAGRELDFALFATQCDGLSPADAGTPSVRWLGDDVYEVRAQVVARDEDDCVLDFGLLAYAWQPPAWMAAGTWVHGCVVLEADSGTIRWSGFCEERGFPALMYSWRIRRIVVEHAARIPAPPGDCIRCGNPELKTNDPARRAFTEIVSPDWRRDRREGEMARYYLHCTLLSRIPRMPTNADRERRATDA